MAKRTRVPTWAKQERVPGATVRRFERHDPHRSVSWHPTEGHRTALDHARKGGFPRNDIILVNVTKTCPTCRHDTMNEQHAIYVQADGTLTGSGLDYIREDDLEWANQEAAQLLAAVREYPEMAIYLHERRVP